MKLANGILKLGCAIYTGVVAMLNKHLNASWAWLSAMHAHA